MVPLGGGGAGGGVIAEGVAVDPGEEPDVHYYAVTPHAASHAQSPACLPVAISPTREGAGRSGVAIVNQAFAAPAVAGRADVIGQRFRLDRRQDESSGSP